jgi:hypothetical protein
MYYDQLLPLFQYKCDYLIQEKCDKSFYEDEFLNSIMLSRKVCLLSGDNINLMLFQDRHCHETDKTNLTVIACGIQMWIDMETWKVVEYRYAITVKDSDDFVNFNNNECRFK